MRTLIIGATGNIGHVAADTLEERGHEVIRASRSSTPGVDVTDPGSVTALFEQVSDIDAVIVACGSVPFKHVTELTGDDYLAGLTSKTLGQLEVARQAFAHLNDGGSITLTTGVLSREPIANGAAAAAANGALDAFVAPAAAEAPRGIRVNVVSPDVLANSPHHHPTFAGHRPVTDEEVGRAYVLATEGIVNGRIITV
ncbi:MAG: short chain dehydrogenase [Mycobacteriaceae bacterium]|uniref:short chain dehydrogenase n=1 Tax=Corynebacterium sp. TaxID=1720 RepID=UPI003F9C1391